MASEFKKKAFWRAVIAEFLAMIFFVFISIGAALGLHFPIQDKANETVSRSQDIVKVSLAFGLAIATMAQSVGHISGAHLNPAVTWLSLSCQISILKAIMYIIAQCLGAVVATAILSGITSNVENNTLGLNGLSAGVTAGQGLGVEIMVTFQLVLCVAVTDKRRHDISGSIPLAIGLSVALGHLIAIDYTGCGMNPARSFGSAVVTKNFQYHWIFWVGPMIGGAAARPYLRFHLSAKDQRLNGPHESVDQRTVGRVRAGRRLVPNSASPSVNS
uniref:Aquaporin n=1 Tax=Rhinella marina TaxID=8386 RepID=Q90250_RHIMB|nr:aquaporin [Rhinella marina]prf//2206276A aquaporin [Rhinella marina]